MGGPENEGRLHMSQQVQKYVLSGETTEFEMPKGAVILSVELSMYGPAIFALGDPDAETETRTFHVSDIRSDLPDGIDALHYRGTAKVPGGPTFIVFETTGVTASA